jgi:HD-like signal output (HDOD) protein
MIGTASTRVNLKDLLTRGQLLALPQSAVQLLQLSQNPEIGLAELAVPIESDPGLAMQVLRFVNSSYFGFARKITSVRLAMSLVGPGTVRNFVLWSAVFSLVPNPKCGTFDLRVAWQDSLLRAIFARCLAQKLGVGESEDPFPAALLQDVALPLLARALPQVYAKLFQDRGDGTARLSDLERRHFGWTHAEAGALICREWGLPERLASLVEAHAGAEHCRCGTDDSVKATVALSALLPSAVDTEWAEHDRFDRLFAEPVFSCGPTITDLMGEVDRQYSELAPALRLPPASQSLAQFCEGIVPGTR